MARCPFILPRAVYITVMASGFSGSCLLFTLGRATQRIEVETHRTNCCSEQGSKCPLLCVSLFAHCANSLARIIETIQLEREHECKT